MASTNQTEFAVPATPCTAENITSNTMQAKKKPDDASPTPRFVPETGGRVLRRRSVPSATSTPRKPPARRTTHKAIVFPDVQEIPSTPRKQSQPATVLSEWYIKFMKEMAGKTGDLPPFILIGQQMTEGQSTEQLWHTTLIMRIKEGASFDEWSFYTNRSEYKLSGKICIREMVPLGFTQDFVRAFLNGFPKNWKELLWAAFNNMKQACSKPVSSRGASVQKAVPRAVSMPSLTVPMPSLSVSMPSLAFEKEKRQRVQPQKRPIEYASSSSSDNEAVIRTLRDIHYDDDIFRRPSRKKRRTTDKHGDNTVASGMLKKILQKKRNLQKQIDVLDEKMEEIMKQMEKKVARQERINVIKARDCEDRGIRKKTTKSRNDRNTENFLRRTQTIYTSSSDSDLVCVSNDEDSSEPEVIADGEEWKRTPRYRKQRIRPSKKEIVNKKRPAPKQNVINLFDDINNEYSDTDIIENPKKTKKRTWRQIDLDRLKHAIDVIKVNSEEDWEKISKTVGPDFSPEDCKDVAIKKLHWKPPQVKEKRTDAEEPLVIKAREGTQAYGIQLNEKHRQYMLGAGSQGGDCFREQAPEDDDEMAMTNVADLDESILAALKTPTIEEIPPKRRVGPFIPAVIGEDTPRSTRKSLTVAEQNTAQRETHQRYLHQITNNRSMFNMSKQNNTTMLKVGTSRAAENIGKKMDRIKKDVHAQRRKKNDNAFDDEEEGFND